MNLDERLRQTAEELDRAVSDRSKPMPKRARRRITGPVIALATAAAVLIPVLIVTAVVFTGDGSAPLATEPTETEGQTGSTSAPVTSAPAPVTTWPPTTLMVDSGLSEADLATSLSDEGTLVLAEEGVALAVEPIPDANVTSLSVLLGFDGETRGSLVDLSGGIPDAAVWLKTTTTEETTRATVFGLVAPGSETVKLQLAGLPELETSQVWERPEIDRAVFLGSVEITGSVDSDEWEVTLTTGDGETIRILLEGNVEPILTVEDTTTLTLFLPKRPLVVDSQEVETLPGAIVCQAPDDVDTPPNRGGVGTGADPHQNPEAALQGFVDQTAANFGLATSGFVELISSGELIGYGVEFMGGSGYVTVVSLTQDDQGWTVDHWEASGC